MKKHLKVLSILPGNSLYPPLNGGMQRTLHVLHQLSIHTDLTVISPMDATSVNLAKVYYPNLGDVNFIFIKGSFDIPFWLQLMPAKLSAAVFSRLITKTLFKSANGLLLTFFRPVLDVLRGNDFDIIVYENLATLDLAKIIRKKYPGISQVYNAFNFDTQISQNLLSSRMISSVEFSSVKLTEEKLFKFIDILWTCSEIDANLFNVANNGKIFQIDVIPNGTIIFPIQASINNLSKFELLFVGSLNYEPNDEGLIWFISNVFPLIKSGSVLKIVGSGECSYQLKVLIDSTANVELIGYVDSLDDYYINASIVVVPILSGSGTRLKALEAMNYQKAIVSTAKGIEGILIDDEIIIVDDPHSMALSINELLLNDSARLDIGIRARKLVERLFDWNVIGLKIAQSLEKKWNINRD